MDREHKKRLLVLTADIGKANGMRAGAEIMLALIQGRKRIAAEELDLAAKSMNDAADRLDARTKLEMMALGADGADWDKKP